MIEQKQIMTKFYEAFQNLDWKEMNALYSRDVTFTDPIFTKINYEQVIKMWEMLLTSGNFQKLEFKVLEDENNDVITIWKATYNFGTKKRLVINEVTSRMKIKDGMIIEQVDNFDFYKWAKQAMGFIGRLLGNTTLIKNKVKKTALEKINKFQSSI